VLAELLERWAQCAKTFDLVAICGHLG
jgi:hypothetical protein